MGRKTTTTIYVSFETPTAGECFDVLTHDGYPDILEPGVSLAANFGACGVAIVERSQAEGLVNQFNHAPGVTVTGQETH